MYKNVKNVKYYKKRFKECVKIMKILNYVVLTLVIVGALNWLLVGLFEFNLVDSIFGELSFLTRIIYGLVGLAGIWSIAFYSKISD